MNTGKERLRRWRERNRAEGKQSFTIMLSKEAREVLCNEKKASGASYAAIIENALLHFRKPGRTYMTHNHKVKSTKILIDENSIVLEDIARKERPVKEITVEDTYNLREGFLPRLLRASSGRLFRLKK